MFVNILRGSDLPIIYYEDIKANPPAPACVARAIDASPASLSQESVKDNPYASWWIRYLLFHVPLRKTFIYEANQIRRHIFQVRCIPFGQVSLYSRIAARNIARKSDSVVINTVCDFVLLSLWRAGGQFSIFFQLRKMNLRGIISVYLFHRIMEAIWLRVNCLLECRTLKI